MAFIYFGVKLWVILVKAQSKSINVHKTKVFKGPRTVLMKDCLKK